MASITVRDIGEDTKARLSAQAAREGKSLEGHVRDILRTATDVGPDARVLMAIFRFALEGKSLLCGGGAFPTRSYLAIYEAVTAASSDPQNGPASCIMRKLQTGGEAVEASEIEAAFLDLHARGVLAFADAAVLGMTLACLHDVFSDGGGTLVPTLENLMTRSAGAMERLEGVNAKTSN